MTINRVTYTLEFQILQTIVVSKGTTSPNRIMELTT